MSTIGHARLIVSELRELRRRFKEREADTEPEYVPWAEGLITAAIASLLVLTGDSRTETP